MPQLAGDRRPWHAEALRHADACQLPGRCRSAAGQLDDPDRSLLSVASAVVVNVVRWTNSTFRVQFRASDTLLSSGSGGVEVLGLRMVHDHCRGGLLWMQLMFRRQLHPDALRLQQPDQIYLLRHIRAGWVAKRIT